MTTEHPIVPPPELIQKWSEQFEAGRSLYAMFEDIYRAGAAAELEACCEWLQHDYPNIGANALRATRRPKPQSLKEQALETLKYPKDFWSEAEVDTIRRALEQLDD
jgi:hypothetical protein